MNAPTPSGDPTTCLSRTSYDAVILDLDGVLTDTAALHAQAWKETFDRFLSERGTSTASSLRPFSIAEDYGPLIDGRPRLDGVRAFLAARGIALPEGAASDPADAPTVWGLGNGKNRRFTALLQALGPKTDTDCLIFVQALRAAGFKLAVATSSRNGRAVLEAADLSGLFDAIVDGNEAARANLGGKPLPDIFLHAATALDAVAERTVVVEDAAAGVAAARSGGFGRVIGVCKSGDPGALTKAGADPVVTSLAAVKVLGPSSPRALPMQALPHALTYLDTILQAAGQAPLAVFLDYDGTLTQIVERPDLAILEPEMRETLRRLMTRATVAIVSGRSLEDLRTLVGVEGLHYAGDHGFAIDPPDHKKLELAAVADLPTRLDRIEKHFSEELGDILGLRLERKQYSIAIHYRQVGDAAAVARIRACVQARLEGNSGLRLTEGKKVLEIQPNIDWNKGKAVLWILDTLRERGRDCYPIYLGDDITDEDAFKALAPLGTGIVVEGARHPSFASYRLRDCTEVRAFLEALLAKL